MASLSLPRVLQLKKNSLDAEREQFEKFQVIFKLNPAQSCMLNNSQSLAINKAINSIETPVKEKHVRSTIIGTFQEQSAITYWMVAIRLPLQDNRIVAWKFCHVTHKLLREGHPACLDDSQRHIGMIENLGKLWVHLREGYGRLVHLYCALLVTKLKFHARNPRFPGNMQLTADELDNIAENDVNNYFQLCVELFDYMDEILNLQAAVFDSLGNARANSMTASGQCRLAALIPCAQDSSHIYDCNVRLLFRLHAALPPDTLAGHRERFRQQFKKLSQFYKHASSLQYYRNLLTLPVLPSNPPNFLLQSDFGTYVTPVVSIPEPPPDEVDAVGALIDTSDTMSQRHKMIQATTPDNFDAFDTRATPSPQPDPVVERDRLIDHLQNELKRMRSESQQLVQERNTMLSSMKEHCTRLESQLQATKTELDEERQKAELLSTETPEIKQKLIETEEKAKVTDEKFQKLKVAYTQLREEHIKLIRQKAEVDKITANLRAAAAQHESAKAALQQQLNDRMKDVELLQQSASSSEEIEAYKIELSNLRTELEQSRQKEAELETLRASMEALEIEHKTASAEQLENLSTVTNELKEVTEALEIIRKEKEERDNELNKVNIELAGLREKSGEEYKKAVQEKDSALKQLEELKQQHQQEKEVYETKLKEKEELYNRKVEEFNIFETEKALVIDKLNALIIELKSECNLLEKSKKDKIESLNAQVQEKEKNFENIISEKCEALANAEKKNEDYETYIEDYETKIATLVLEKRNEHEYFKKIIANKDTELQILESRLSHGESSRLNAECELQDLLQHNTVLEADLAAAKRQLEDLKKELEIKSNSIVTCASAAAAQVTTDALTALELGNAQETTRAAAELAAKVLEDLAKKTEIRDNEEEICRAAIHAAHSTASLAAYVTDIAHAADIELADKLSSECRAMLTATKQCLESLSKGTAPGASCSEACDYVKAVAAAARQRDNGACTSVDDELADMDTAIELAASQIEEMLKASRAGDTGLKLEVNEKILDACTTLMAAVKILVQDSRNLQNELGDPKTRQKMYRRNPQWSEGLISAAKAVVFAAKLLVSSADTAVRGGGRVEGVSAAAHEVATATAQLVAASRARAPPAAPALARLTAASRAVAAATAALVAAVRAAAHSLSEQDALDTSSLTLTATRILEMESKVRALELETALEGERTRLAALRKRHYQLAQLEENGNMTNGKQ